MHFRAPGTEISITEQLLSCFRVTIYSTCIQLRRAPSTNAAATVQENYTTCNAFFPGVKQFTSFHLFFPNTEMALAKILKFYYKNLNILQCISNPSFFLDLQKLSYHLITT